MTTNVFSVLNIAKVGLLSQQLAIEVTGQNIANVQTEGYTRQEVTLETTTPRQIGLGLLGTGVRIGGVERAHNQFIFNQIISEEKPMGNFAMRKEVYDKLETLFNEQEGRSLNAGFSDFFNSWQDLSSNPTGLPERSTVLAEAENLAAIFSRLGEDLFDIQLDIDAQIDAEVADINSLTDRIAKLNQQIHGSESGVITANDLRDERDRLVRELAEKIDIDVVDEMNGQLSLTFENGRPLILGDRAFQLSTQLNGNNRSFKDVFLDDGSGNPVNITQSIQDGEIRGLIDMRDDEVEGFKDQLDRLAAVFVREVNRVHQEGVDLSGNTGLNFFEPLSPTVFTDINNAGTATVTVTNGDPSQSSVDKYEIVFTGGNSFTLNNQTTGLASGTFTFTAGSTFNLANGLAITISGGAVAGDRFRFSNSENASTRMRLSNDVKGRPTRIAAGLNTTSDGNNALELGNLQNNLIFDSTSGTAPGSGTFTFDEFYSAMISEVGVGSRSANNAMEQQEGILLQLDNRREGISGVSIDEEMLNLIKFQQAFNAAARLVTTVQEMFDTIQNRI